MTDFDMKCKLLEQATHAHLTRIRNLAEFVEDEAFLFAGFIFENIFMAPVLQPGDLGGVSVEKSKAYRYMPTHFLITALLDTRYGIQTNLGAS